jgi:hypothetical protein
MYTTWAPFGFMAGGWLAFFCLYLRHLAFGRCAVCELERSPKCGCPGGNPDAIDARRPRFKSRDPKDHL